MEPPKHVFITGPESSGGSLVARTIAHVLDVVHYDDWDGMTPHTVEGDTARVQHSSLPYSNEALFPDVQEWLRSFGGAANLFVLTTRDNGISIRSKMRRSGVTLETARQHNAAASRLMGEIASSDRSHFFFSCEAFIALGSTYLRDLYTFLGVDTDFMPPLIDANARYLKDPLTEDGPRETIRPSLRKDQMVRVDIVHARRHMPETYRDYLEGYRAVRLIKADDTILGELVWRVGSGHNIEIAEFGIFDVHDRRKGFGTQLLETALDDMRQYFARINHSLWKVYLFCEERNEEARAFYEARGFRLEAVLTDFYDDGNAVMYVQSLKRAEE